ncbi:MAG: hypothetical protein V4724_04625 [Pseudomonadota bacterium]
MMRALTTRRHFLLTKLVAGCCLLHRPAWGGPVAQVIYPRHLGPADSRYDYDWLVLRTALEKSTPAFGSFEMRQSPEQMSPQRVMQELGLANGRINVCARATAASLERDFLPVRIPIDKGLLGFRVFLVRADDLPRFAAVRTVQDLRSLRAGQGKGWVDIPILAAAGIPVVEGTHHEHLFSMLAAGRFDFFSRGVDEAWVELKERHAQFPQMVIEPTLLLHYPLPRYLFVRRDAEGELLARRLQAGLETMVRDGTLSALFRQHKGPLIERAGLSRRRVLTLPNSGMTPETPLNRSELWYNPVAGK